MYVPNSGSELLRLDYRQTWDADFLKYLKGLEAKKPVVVCGDMNVAHKSIDLARPKANYNKSAGHMQEEIDGMDNFLASGLADTFRYVCGEEVKYSWWSYRGGAIYCNFKNKEDLAVKAFQHNVEMVLGPLGTVIRDAKSAPEKLRAITQFYRSYFETVASRGGCPVLNVGIDAKYINPELYTAARQVADQLMGNLERILQKGIEFGQLRPEINVKAVASNFYAMIDGGIYLASLNDNQEHLDHVLDLADELIKQLCLPV